MGPFISRRWRLFFFCGTLILLAWYGDRQACFFCFFGGIVFLILHSKGLLWFAQMVCFVVFGGFGGPGGGLGGPGGGLNDRTSSGKPLQLLRFKKH